jgi:hypothetical protein
MGDDWGRRDPEDDEEEIQATARGKVHVEAWGDSDIPDGQDGEDILKKMARSHAEGMVRVLADVAYNGVKDAARNTAAKELLARGFGAVTRKSEQKVDVTVVDQRAAHFSALQELAKRNPVLDISDAEFEEIPSARTPRLEKRKSRDDDE